MFVPGEGDDALSWDDLAGAESLKDEIEGTVVLALQVRVCLLPIVSLRWFARSETGR